MISKKKILVVEDNKMNRMLLCEIVTSVSIYEVLEAENGQEALRILKQYGEEISLILLDLVMPVMDGYTFLSIIKEDPAYASVPVIVTTQSDSESDEVTALSRGATDFVTKPYKAEVILHRIANIINLRETASMVNLLQYDRLTGLFSKEFFYQRVKPFLEQRPDREYDIICSDIENFKLVNDIFGVPAGDQILRGIADMYINQVGERGICGRLTSDKFVCLIEHQSRYREEWFREAVRKINELSNVKNIVMKWGIYSKVDRSLSVEQMCDWALLAAQSIKGQYGKYYAYYGDQLRSRLLLEQAITDSMESALAKGQFKIYLQPKYRIRDNALSGAEALIRWNHPKLGIQSPGQFIPIFEQNGFITKLDQFVWDRTCAVLHEWDQKGYPQLSVSVNVSRADIYNAELADVLMSLVEKYSLTPSRLHLEITESAYTENPKQIIDTVTHLRKLGFVIEMDDFGSGYSSLNMINQMPLDVLKLDMKFIQNETAKPVHQGILRFIMGLARSMNLNVVAEGVETKEQLERLRQFGCDYVQGYYFARPMPCEEFETLLCRSVLEPAVFSCPNDDRKILLAADEICRRRELDLQKEAYRDYMTDLLNRRGFMMAMEMVRMEEGPCAVFFFDLDGLKKINDTYGHSKGDEAICRFGEILRAHIRETDVAARYGGDEFVVVMKCMRTEEDAVKKGEEICRAIQEDWVFQEVPSACSAGIAIWNLREPIQEVIEKADQALYQVKRESRGGCRLWKA